MIKAVVFDLDDTLISESQYQISANLAVLQHLSDETGIALDEVKKHSGVAAQAPRSEYFQQLLPRLGLASDRVSVSNLISVHRSHSPTLDWYPDVLEVVGSLRALGARLGVITDGYSIAQHQKLKAVEASKHFDAIIVSDDLGREFWKPHSRTFREIAEQLNVSPEEMLYVGDNPEKDFYISHTLGVKTARIVHEDSIKSNREYREGIKEDFLLENLKSIVTLYSQLSQDGTNGSN